MLELFHNRHHAALLAQGVTLFCTRTYSALPMAAVAASFAIFDELLRRGLRSVFKPGAAPEEGPSVDI